jgi:MYXO-CTERM domain-containing protein
MLASAATVAAPAYATYAIAATDSATQEVGGAVTSCVQGLDLEQVYGSAPGFGVVHAQAQLDTRLRGRDRAVELLMEGLAPSEILTQITARSFDAQAASRQYAVVDLSGRAAGFSGMQAQAFRDDRQGTIGSFTYSVQGNILTSERVLEQAATAFEADSCDLAERLMRALEAGGDNGEGDSRCTGEGIPSDGAFIRVDRPGQPAGDYLNLQVSDTAPNNPLPRLREMFDAWRATHPCSAPTAGSGGTGVGGASSGGQGGANAGGAPAAGSGGTESGGAAANGGSSPADAGPAADGGRTPSDAGAAPSGGSTAADAGPTGGTLATPAGGADSGGSNADASGGSTPSTQAGAETTGESGARTAGGSTSETALAGVGSASLSATAARPDSPGCQATADGANASVAYAFVAVLLLQLLATRRRRVRRS